MEHTAERMDCGGMRVDEMLPKEVVEDLIGKFRGPDLPAVVLRGRHRVSGLTAEMLGTDYNGEDIKND